MDGTQYPSGEFFLGSKENIGRRGKLLIGECRPVTLARSSL
jgi:hypothetical protein